MAQFLTKKKTFSEVIFSHQEKINDLSSKLMQEFSSQNVINYAIGINNFAAILSPYIYKDMREAKMIEEVDEKLEFYINCLSVGIDVYTFKTLNLIQKKYSFLNKIIYQYGLLDRKQDRHPEEGEDDESEGEE